MTSEEEILAGLRPGCICKGIKMRRIMEAIALGADSYEEVSRRTGIGGGSCKSRRCREKVEALLREKNGVSR